MSNSSALATTAKEQLRLTMIVFIAIAFGAIVFMLISLVLVQLQGNPSSTLSVNSLTLKIILAVVALACQLIGRSVFVKKVAAAKNSLNPLRDKLIKYREGLISLTALAEIPVILSAILFLLTGDFSFLIFGAVLLGFLLAAIPIKKKVVAQLELDGLQQQELE